MDWNRWYSRGAMFKEYRRLNKHFTFTLLIFILATFAPSVQAFFLLQNSFIVPLIELHSFFQLFHLHLIDNTKLFLPNKEHNYGEVQFLDWYRLKCRNGVESWCSTLRPWSWTQVLYPSISWYKIVQDPTFLFLNHGQNFEMLWNSLWRHLHWICQLIYSFTRVFIK